jgi:hypothetical protein
MENIKVTNGDTGQSVMMTEDQVHAMAILTHFEVRKLLQRLVGDDNRDPDERLYIREICERFNAKLD